MVLWPPALREQGALSSGQAVPAFAQAILLYLFFPHCQAKIAQSGGCVQAAYKDTTKNIGIVSSVECAGRQQKRCNSLAGQWWCRECANLKNRLAQSVTTITI